MIAVRLLIVSLVVVHGFASPTKRAHEFWGPAPGVAAQQPQVAAAPDGAVYLVYGAGNTIYCAVSQDGGDHFAPPVVVNSQGVLALGRHRGPRVVATQRAVVIGAVVGKQGKGRDGNLMVWRSTDRGRTWSAPQTLNDAADSAREGLHGMAAGAGDLVFATWLDLRGDPSLGDGTKLYGVVSRDGGRTWGSNQMLYRSPDGSICQCCHPSASIDPRGMIHVMWRNALGGSRDLYHLFSSDRGKSFSPPQKFGNGTWPLNSCPMDGGDIAVTGDGQVTSVWRRQEEVYVSTLGGQERLLGKGKNPVIAYGKKGAFIAWEDAAMKGVVLLSPGQAHPGPIALQSRSIDLTVRRDGRVVAAWEETEGDRRLIRLQVLE